ncbi:peroxiredoxin family protein [Chitinophaga arvensicola]|uniref:Peroxiredoxin n=1 Tax=Chitinophaga arvensicola TaxID=29529 RepID=A0A1I0S7A2_9BACT|nr:TlpA disulfide reductase family protein [Chitinophaga arvensicola]SEW51595.1 Peroxiredoxin [Chitinophaga arvensicola]
MKTIWLYFFLFLSCIFTVGESAAKDIQISIRNYDSTIVGQPIQIDFFNRVSLVGNWPISETKGGEIGVINKTSVINFSGREGYLRFNVPNIYMHNFDGYPIFVKEGDDVIMTLRNGIVNFEGPQAARYNCQIKLLKTHFTSRVFNMKGNIDSAYLGIIMEDYDLYKSKLLRILNQFKNRIDSHDFDIIQRNVIWEIELMRISFIRNSAMMSPSDDEKIICFKFLKSFLRSGFLKMPDKVDLFSYSFYDYLLKKEMLLAEISGFESGTGAHFETLYSNIVNNYVGVLKDRVLAGSILGFVPFRDTTDFYRDKALKVILDPFSKDILTRSQIVFGAGMPAFEFRLQDTTGHFFSLSDFRGKIVVVDFFFKGCTGCAHLATGMDEVVPRFKGDSNIVFISISVDKTMSTFKSSVRSGIYTNPVSINLYTNGKGEDHEIVKYYAISGYPFLMVIDSEGKIMDCNPPYPNFGEGFTQKFIDILNSSLKKLELSKS